ncbi:MAG TPA: carbohydrate kinase family protein [Novimethylophilus sp.]|jgi:adenosine kinase|uniref:carbohydrate kinase family protein n=1 Tax=Novimethylophilus sp. TaxID=2137426 RepID=UPI002F3F3C9B
MQTLICGSLAYDTIMVFHDQFKNHILPDKIHILNVAFLVPDMRREFGGTAGNIAYNLNLLGGKPLIMATVGDDFVAYASWLNEIGLDMAHVRRIAKSYTAQAFITTDVDDNQITAFHPGAMNFSHENKVADANGVKLGIIAPDGRDGMFLHAREFHDAGIPFLFDPGQGMPMFSGDELMEFTGMADYLALNDYEAQLMQEKTGQTVEALAKQVKALVVTLGAKGSVIYAEGQRYEIPCVEADAVVDPTGCGDAYRAGLLYGVARGWDWQTTGQLAAVMGAIKIASRGGQNHKASREEIAQRFQKAFGKGLFLS